MDRQFSEHHLLMMLAFLQCMFLASLSNMKSLKLCVLMFGLGLHVCFCARIILFCYYSSVIRLKIQFVIPPTLFFLLRIILSSILYCSLFHDFFSAYAKDKIGILIGIAFDLEAAFGTKVTFHNVNSINP